MTERVFEWDAKPVKNEDSNSSAGSPLHGQGQEGFLIPLLTALTKQTEAINRLAQSNEMLVQAMAEGEGMDPEDRPITVGLNGRPL